VCAGSDVYWYYTTSLVDNWVVYDLQAIGRLIQDGCVLVVMCIDAALVDNCILGDLQAIDGLDEDGRVLVVIHIDTWLLC